MASENQGKRNGPVSFSAITIVKRNTPEKICGKVSRIGPLAATEMRPLTEPETKTLFTKLASYIGRNITSLIDRPTDTHVFRLHKDRVYYVSSHIANLATSLPRQNLLSLGTCLGKFSKTGKFRLHVTALDFLAQHAMYKVWVKPNGEMPFLYGNHVLKAHVGRITQDTPEHQGVVVYSMSDIPLVYGLKKLIHLGIWSYGEVNDGFEKVGAYCDSGISSRGCRCLFTGGGYHVLVGSLIAVFNCDSTIMVSDCDVVTSLGQTSNTATPRIPSLFVSGASSASKNIATRQQFEYTGQRRLLVCKLFCRSIYE
jgi:60S ribosome subunit biogenesis protein NIP7